jgi:hypothetical protein
MAENEKNIAKQYRVIVLGRRGKWYMRITRRV